MMVVLVFPIGDDHPGLGQGPEAVDIEAFIADAGVERLDVAVAPGFTRRDETQSHLRLRPGRHCRTGHFRAVVAAQYGRIGASVGGDTVKLLGEVLPGDVALHQAAETFAGVFVHDRDDLDRSAVGGHIELEVRRPHQIRAIRSHRRRG